MCTVYVTTSLELDPSILMPSIHKYTEEMGPIQDKSMNEINHFAHICKVYSLY